MTKKKQANKNQTVKQEIQKIAKQKIDDREKVKSGMIVKVHEKIHDVSPKGEPRERVQIFEGMVLARKHGREPGATILVRKESSGVFVEKIYPLYSPIVERIEIIKQYKMRRSKLYYLRQGYKKRLKEVKK